MKIHIGRTFPGPTLELAAPSMGQHLRQPETKIGENDDDDHHENLQAHKWGNSAIHLGQIEPDVDPLQIENE